MIAELIDLEVKEAEDGYLSPEDVKELLHGPETDNIQNTLKL